MDKYLVEVPHEATESACVSAIKIFHETGSHFLSNADWGCEDGEHKAWMVIEVNNREEALRILPAKFRSEAKIVRLKKYTREDYEEYKKTGHVQP